MLIWEKFTPIRFYAMQSEVLSQNRKKDLIAKILRAVGQDVEVEPTLLLREIKTCDIKSTCSDDNARLGFKVCGFWQFRFSRFFSENLFIGQNIWSKKPRKSRITKNFNLKHQE